MLPLGAPLRGPLPPLARPVIALAAVLIAAQRLVCPPLPWCLCSVGQRGRTFYMGASGNNKIPNNFRPVSLKPIISKVLEGLIKNNLEDYIKFNNIFTWLKTFTR